MHLIDQFLLYLFIFLTGKINLWYETMPQNLYNHLAHGNLAVSFLAIVILQPNYQLGKH